MTSPEPIHTLADLDTWSFDGTALAVLGHPIKHSISPPMHNAALARMAEQDSKFASWKYFRFDIAPEDLPVALKKFHARGFKGLNLTVPHKIIAFGLPEVAVTPAAKSIGAVNTLQWTASGWNGHNTDGYGLATGIQEDLQRDLADAEIILLGAGGAARGAAIECGHQNCKKLWLVNRTFETREQLRHMLAVAWESNGPTVQILDLNNPPKELPRNALIINATSAGLKPTDPLPVDLSTLPRPAGVYDMIYNPPETPLLAQARALGIPAANGLSMLVHQGVRSLEIWSGAVVPVDAMRAAVHSAIKAHA